MNIVFLTGLYHPRYSAVGKCVKNLAAAMARDHNVSVLSIRQWDSPSDGARGCGGEALLFATTPVDSLKARCQFRMRGDAGASRMAWRALDRGLSAWRYAQRCCTKTAFHESIAHALFKRLEEMPDEPDVLIPCCGMFEHVMACVRYKRKHPAARLAPVLFDQFAFAGTLYRSEFQKRLHRSWNLQVEDTVLAESDKVFTITWEREVERYHPEWLHKVVRIEHPLLVEPRMPSCADGERRAAVFAGSLDMQCRDPEYAIDLFTALRKADAESPTLDFFALGPGAEAVRRREEGSFGAIRWNPPRSSSDIEGVLANAEMLVSIGNKTSDQKPSKQVEYMALGKPIVHIAATREDAALEDLARYPLALTLFEGDDFDVNVARLKSFVRESKGCELSFDEVAGFFPEALPDYVASLIEDAGGGGVFCTPVA